MTERVTITSGWPASPTITASGDTSVAIRNTDALLILFWAITDDDTAPAFEVPYAHRIFPEWNLEKSERGFDLKDGERLWLASANGAMMATITTGGA